MIGNATRSPLVPVAAPAAVPTPAGKATQPEPAAHPFAEMLRQNRQAEAPAAAQSKTTKTTESKSSPTTAHADDDASPATPVAPPASREAAQAKARTAAATRAPARATVPPARAMAGTDKGHDGKDEDAASTTPSSDASATAMPGTASPALLSPRNDAAAGERGYGSAMNASAANGSARDLDASGAAAASDSVPVDGSARTGTSAGIAEARRDVLATTADAVARAAEKKSENHKRDATPSFAEGLAEIELSRRADAASLGERSHAASASTTALAEPARSAAPVDEAAMARPTVSVPIESPEFAAAFGLQVSTLAREGVQRAELHLNPTDMGPVSIQITLDGTQARVDFGADVAATRHAIEAGLPELASALRDAGFTLAGGGVAQHSRSNSGEGDGSGDAGSRRSAPAAVARLDATAQRATRRTAAGSVDLYA